MPRSNRPRQVPRIRPFDPRISPSAPGRASAPAFRYFGVHRRGLRTRYLRFAAWVTPGPRKTRFWLVATLRRRDSHPHGPSRRFPRPLLTLLRSSLPPPPGLAWRTPGTYLVRIRRLKPSGSRSCEWARNLRRHALRTSSSDGIPETPSTSRAFSTVTAGLCRDGPLGPA